MAEDSLVPTKGLPPGTAVYTGPRETAEVSVVALDYSPDGVTEQVISDPGDCCPFRDTAAPTWIRVGGVHDVALVEKLGEVFGLHPLVVEDIVNVHQRPKLEEHDGYLFLVVHLARYVNQEVELDQVTMVLGDQWLLTFQEAGVAAFDVLRGYLHNGTTRLRSMGPDYLAYRLLDIVIDHYFEVLEKLSDDVEQLEDDVVARPRKVMLETLHEMKRDLIELRRAIWPLRELVLALQHYDGPLIDQETGIYFRDLYDHAVMSMEMVSSELEILSGVHDLYLNSISNYTNEVMKVLAVISTTFLPMNFLAAVYGMNFHYMPELAKPWAYPAVLLIMAGLATTTLVYFKRKQWI